MMSRKERTPITKQQQKKFHIFSFQTHRNANKKKKKKDKTMAETKREYNNGNVRQTNNNRKKKLISLVDVASTVLVITRLFFSYILLRIS